MRLRLLAASVALPVAAASLAACGDSSPKKTENPSGNSTPSISAPAVSGASAAEYATN